MSYVKRPHQRRFDPIYEGCVSAVMEELGEKPPLVGGAVSSGAPEIIEEQSRIADRLHVYVIWSGWSGVRDDHRSAAILDAYERKLGREYALRIVVALGLTPEEANLMGFDRSSF